MDAKEIRELFKRHNVPLSRDDVWEIQGNPVVKHQALERMSSTLGIIWHKPEVLRAERDEAVLIVTGNLPSGPAEWSIGEAVIGQNLLARNKTAIYPYAMAEKRAKDRVILKLAGMYGSHSEEEADDFKQKPEPDEPRKPSKHVYMDGFMNRLLELPQDQLLEWAKTERRKVWPQYGIEPHDEDGRLLIAAYKAAVGEEEDA